MPIAIEYHRIVELRICKFINQHIPGNRTQGLTWYADAEMGGEPQWGDGGSDPGSNTDTRLFMKKGVGAIVFANSNDSTPTEISSELLSLAPDL